MGAVKKMDLAPDFKPPIELLVQKIAILARTGAGKTNTAVVIAEEVMDAKQQVVVLDPKGDWWGLRSSADGKEPAYPIAVLGGDHSDLPGGLEPTAGALVADVAADGASMVIDLSTFTNADMRRFVTDFAERFYRAKANHVSPVLLVFEEADEVVPQRFGGELARMVGAIERIVKRGRFRGIGTLLVTQRSASLNKDVLTQTEVLIVQQTTAPQDKKAIDAWVESHQDQEKRAELMANIASLKKGEAYVWSPTFLEMFTRVRFRLRRTYDAGRDVKIGEMRATPKVLAPVDIAALGERMKATVEKAKQNDPTQLRRRVLELEDQLRKKPAPAPAAPKRVEVPILTAKDRAAIERMTKAAEDLGGKTMAWFANFRDVAVRLTTAISAASTTASPPVPVGPRTPPASPRGPQSVVDGAVRAASSGKSERPEGRVLSRTAPNAPARANGEISRMQQRSLDILLMLERLGHDDASKINVAAWRSVKPGGSFSVDMARILELGYVEPTGPGRVRLTDQGRAIASDEGMPTTLGELHERIGRGLSPRERDLLATIVEAHPNALTPAEAAERLGVKPGGSFSVYVGHLRDMGLIAPRGALAATDILFPAALAA